MARRTIRTGDTLKAGTVLYFNFPTELIYDTKAESPILDNLGSLVKTSSGYEIIFGGWTGGNSDGSKWLSRIKVGLAKSPKYYFDSVVEIPFYASSAVDDGTGSISLNLTSYTLTSDLGQVTSIKKDALGFFEDITIEVENELSAVIYYNNQRIKNIYYQNKAISYIMFQNQQLEQSHFFLGNSDQYDFKFYMDEGQTWKQWIDQGKYYDSTMEFSYDSSGYIICSHGMVYDSVTGEEELANKAIIKNRQYKLSHACLSSETLIKTLNGNRLISSLQPGEKLLNNNEITKVVKHNRSYYYEIILNNNNIIKASNDHKFILVNAEIKHTEQLKINDYFTNDLYIKEIRKINQLLDMYELKTSTNKYELYNGIICECENI